MWCSENARAFSLIASRRGEGALVLRSAWDFAMKVRAIAPTAGGNFRQAASESFCT